MANVVVSLTSSTPSVRRSERDCDVGKTQYPWYINYTCIYSGTSLIQTPWGQKKVSLLPRSAHAHSGVKQSVLSGVCLSVCLSVAKQIDLRLYLRSYKVEKRTYCLLYVAVSCMRLIFSS